MMRITWRGALLVAFAMLTTPHLVLPAAADDMGQSDSYPRVVDLRSGPDWMWLRWSTPDGYDHVHVRLWNNERCASTPEHFAAYDGAETSAVFTGLVQDGVYAVHVVAHTADEGYIGGFRSDDNQTTQSSRIVAEPLPQAVTAGSPVEIRAQLELWKCFREVERTPGWDPADRLVTLQGRSSADEAWRDIDHQRASWGRVSFEHSPRSNTSYRLVYGGDADAMPAEADVGSVVVSPDATATTDASTYQPSKIASAMAYRSLTVRPRVIAALGRDAIRLDHPVSVSGRVRPAHPGRRVYLQRRTPDGWRTVRHARLDAASAYSMRWWPQSPGEKTLRVTSTAHRDHGQGRSRRLTLTVLRRN